MSKQARPMLTADLIKELAASPPKSATITLDGDLAAPGFGIRITPNGAATFVLRYRTPAGAERKMKLGPWPAMSATDARNKAKRVLREVLAGRDPLAEIEAERSAPTAGEALDRFEREHMPKLRAATRRDYEGCIRLHIRPALGNVKLADLDYAAIDRLCSDVAGKSKAQAARVLAILSKVCNLAVRWQWLDRNPCHGVSKPHVEARERYLSADETARLLAALDKLADNPRTAQTVRLVTFLLLTGARRGEAMQARWQDFDLAAGVWTKPSTHTKQKRLHRVPLTPAAVALLHNVKEHPAPLAGNKRYGRRAVAAAERAATVAAAPFVFPCATDPSRPMTEPKRAWAAICKAAGIEGLRLHDLRHSFASVLVSSGASLPLIGQMLGHTQVATTARYAHLFDDAQRQAAELVARHYETARNGKVPDGASKPE